MSAEQAYLDKANEHIKLKEYEAVIINLDKALEVNPKNKESYLNKGNALKCLDNKEAALAAFEKAIEIDPRYKEAYFKKGIVLDDLSQKEAALAAFEKAIGIDPHYKEAHFKKGVVLDNLDLKEAALAAFEKAIEIDQHLEFAHYSKGLVLFDLDQKEAAVAALEKAIEINPNKSDYFLLLGECLTELGKFKEAISAYDQAINLNPKDDLAYENKGFALYHLGKLEEAIKCYDMQIEIVPEMWGPFLKKGKALQDLNKTAEALEYFQKGMDIINQGKLEGNIFFPLNGEDVTLNNLELQLISGIKELLTLPILKVTQDEPEEVKTQIQGLNKKRDALKLKFINAVFSAKKTGSKQQQEDIDQLKKELEEVKILYKRMSIDVAQVKADIRDSGMKDLAEVKRGFKALEDQDPELLAYCKTFYWTTTNLFSAYRAISTGLIQVNFETEANQNEDLLVAGAQKATSLLAGVANGIPLVGGLLSQLNTIIDGIYGAVKENRFNNKVAAINKIIQAKLGTEDDISLNVSKIALAVTLAKKKAILFPEISSPSSATTSQKVKAGLEWLSSQVDRIKGQVLPSVELQDQESTGATLALQDVMLFMAYLCKNSEAIIKRKNMGLDQQIVSIIEYNGFEQLLEERADVVNKVQVEINQEEKRSEGCSCAMF